MIHSIEHQTVFEFEITPRSVVQRLHLTPLERPYQRIIDWRIDIEGGEIELETDDYHGNRIHLSHHDMKSNRMEIKCHGQVEVEDTAGIAGDHDNPIPLLLFGNQTPLTEPGPLLKKLGSEIQEHQKDSGKGDVDTLHELSARILEYIRYAKGETDTSTTAEEAMKLGAGVCQDHVHAFIAVARLIGYPSRYVSGYLMMEEGATQEATHAWAEINMEGLGWVGFDISNAISPDKRYVKLATGFDYLDVVPVSGVKFGSSEERLSTSITVSQQ